MIPSKKARERLDNLIRLSKTDDYSSVSILIGKNHAYIQQFISRGIPKRLKEEDRRKLACHFSTPEWELGGPVDRPFTSKNRRGFSESDRLGIVMIPSYDVSASAGFGAFVEREWAEDYMPFQTNFLNSLTHTPSENLSVIKVMGDSMSPTLDDGDQILVDSLETTPGRPGVYVLRSEEVLNVKRVSVNPSTGYLSIKSDNPLYEDWNDVDPGTVQIIGKVLWAGRNL
ncbi:MAG: S24 family peptidase [Sphingomonadales bacterium]